MTSALSPLVIYYTAILVVIILIIIVALCLIYFLLKDFTTDHADLKAHKIRDNAYKKAFKMLDDAKSTSLHILEDAHSKAQRLITDSAAYGKASKQVLDAELKAATERQKTAFEDMTRYVMEGYKKSLDEQEKQNVGTLREVSESLKGELLHEVDEFKNILHRETIESQQRVDQKISAEFKKAEDEIEAYKSRQVKNIDDKIYKILAQVSKDVFGKVLSIEDHEDLILKALEKAKEQGMFDYKK